ncbi:MAG: class I SAM-dependent methyltransferase [Pseudomonadota bacterium]
MDRDSIHDRPPPGPAGPTTHFGFEEVARGDKQAKVREVFERVAGRYDLMNDLMSGGIHRLWKAAMIDWLDPRPGLELLDVAGGTGDIALRVLRRVGADQMGRVVVCDLTPDMLEEGRDRAIDQGVLGGIQWLCGDAQRLPLPDRSVGAYTIAFGLRNVTGVEAALAEARRVLKPGGRFICLEFSHVALPALNELYRLYSFEVLPRLGQLVAGDRAAYQYLVESIRRFPDQEDLVAKMRAAGLERVGYRNLTGGVAALHAAWRL